MSANPVQIQKRRVVYTALSQFLEGESLSRAFALWEKQYADKPVYALNEFVGTLAQSCELKVRRKEVIRTLLNLSQNPTDLRPDPASGFAELSDLSAPSSAPLPERLDKIFEHFLVALETVLPSEAFVRLRLNFLVRLSEMPLNPALKSRLRLWFDSDGGGKVFQVVCTAPEIRRVVNQLYVVMCEIYGPMRADDVLEACVAWLENYHPGCVRDIRRFL